LNRPEWCEQPWTNEEFRREHLDEIEARLTAWSQARADDEAVTLLTSAGVPCAPVTGSGRVPDHPQFVHRGFFEWVEHPIAGRHPVPGLPFRSRRSSTRWNRRPAPTLGRDTDAVLREWLGCSDADIAELEQLGVTGTRPLNLDQEEAT
jgi:crotonobetainyl-CoA:carnitine CoA-transferase CaiB-like acyl-CoA transferase